MIFVIAGNALQPFERLASFASIITEITAQKVYFQNGKVNYSVSPLVEQLGVVSRKEFEDYIVKSDFVITHCGAGTLRTLSELKKESIGIPRLKKFSEHVNDHQLQIAEQFSKMNRIYLPATWENNKQDVLDIYNKFKDFDFNFQEDVTSGDSLNKCIRSLLVQYIN